MSEKGEKVKNVFTNIIVKNGFNVMDSIKKLNLYKYFDFNILINNYLAYFIIKVDIVL